MMIANMILMLLLPLLDLCFGLAPSPNIVIALIDDWGLGDVEYVNSNALGKTPNINSLSKSKHTIVLGNLHSEASCSPSRVAILTGRSPIRDCVMGSSLPNGKALFPAKLNSIVSNLPPNYQSLFLGKFPGAGIDNKWPDSAGFQTYTVIGEGSTYDSPCICGNSSSNHHKKKADEACFLGHNPKLTNLPSCISFQSPKATTFNYPGQIMDSDLLASKFDQWLSTIPSTKSFFAQISFRSVHIPFVASPEIRKSCQDHVICNPTAITSIQLDYGGCSFAIDRAIGNIKRAIKTHRPRDWENTIFVMLSDNGPAPLGGDFAGAGSTNGLRGRKLSLFEGLLHVPGLIEWPAVIKQNTVFPGLVSIMDLPITFADALGIPFQGDGVSLWPRLLGNSTSRGKFLGVCSHTTMLRDDVNMACQKLAYFDPLGKWKLIGSRADPLRSKANPSHVAITTAKLYDLQVGEWEESKNQTAWVMMILSANSWLVDVFQSFAKNCPDYLSSLPIKGGGGGVGEGGD